jgi:hypothetical protein
VKLPVRLSLGVLSSALLASWSHPGSAACLPYGPVSVTLSGRVVLATFFGPPGYGEDPKRDTRERYGLLQLRRPICVGGRPGDDVNGDTEQDVRAVQLVFNDGRAVRRLVGRRVSLSGTLFHQHTGHHHTAVLLSVVDAALR